MVRFRHRIGENGIELILAESIRVNDDDLTGNGDKTAFIDSTVQEKNVTYPSDAKLHRTVIKECQQIAADEKLPLRQSYSRTLKELSLEQRFRNHPKNRKRAIKADKRVKAIVGRLVRELERSLPQESAYRERLSLFNRVLAQTRHTKNKIYSLHEPDVQCISKGKEHKKYEFGNKVSVVCSARGVILGAASFRNPYDGHTIDAALAQIKRLTGKVPTLLAGDCGCRGQKESGQTKIVIPSTPLKRDSRYRAKKRKLFCSRAGIEPHIGHLKSDHRLGRNFYKGLLGNAIRVLLTAAAFNFKRAIRVLCALIKNSSMVNSQ